MKLVIVGGVAGGASAAARARRLDEKAEIILFERGEHISFANCGLPYHVGAVIPKRDNLLIMTPERFRARTGIEVRIRSEVVAIDPAAHAVTVLDRATEATYTETYDKLILSPGATPVRPPIPGIDDPAVTTLWTIADMDRIKACVDRGLRRAVIAGGGFIGIELAENLRKRDVDVTLVEMAPQLMPPFDPEMASPIAAEVACHGVRVMLGTAVSAFRRAAPPDDPGGPGLTVDLSNGRSIPADMAVLAIGVSPNSALARSAGLAVGPRGGIVVDAKLQTSDPDIYAVGDAIQVADALGHPAQIPLAGPANRQGRMAAGNALGGAEEYRATFGTTVVQAFGITAAATGVSEKALRASGTPYEKVYLNPYSHATYYPGAQMMHMKLLFSREGKILGAQVVGQDGVDKRIDVIATAMQAGSTVFDLQRLELAYAPPYGSAKDPVNFAGFVAGNVLAGKTDVVHSDAIPEDALLLDVREPAEFEAGTIPGAKLLPLGELRGRLGELPLGREIVAFCAVGIRGYLAERILKAAGFRARNLSGGYTTWKLFRAVAAGAPEPARTAVSAPPGGPAPSSDDTAPSTCCSAPVPSVGAAPATRLDVRGAQCPGPIVAVKQALDAMAPGARLSVLASDRGFLRDLPSFCDSTGNRLLSLKETGNEIEGVVEKGCGAPAAPSAAAVKRTTLILFSNDLDKAMAALILATGFASLGHEVSLFCTFWGLTVLRKERPPAVEKGFLGRMFGFMLPKGARELALSKMHMMGVGTAMMKHVMRQCRVASIPELIAQAQALGVRFIACEMAMEVMSIRKEELIDGIETAGVANFAGLAERSGTTLFV